MSMLSPPNSSCTNTPTGWSTPYTTNPTVVPQSNQISSVHRQLDTQSSSTKPSPDQFTIWMPAPVNSSILPSLPDTNNALAQLNQLKGQQFQLIQQQYIQTLQQLQKLASTPLQPLAPWNTMNALNQIPSTKLSQNTQSEQKNNTPALSMPVPPSMVAKTVRSKTRVESM